MRTNMSHGPNGLNKPVYAQGHFAVGEPPLEFHIWHKLVAIQPSKRPLSALGACGQRFEPEAFLYDERTLIDWGNDDDLCECAAEMPTEDQCKSQLTQLKIAGA
jgi:hypothetical protein